MVKKYFSWLLIVTVILGGFWWGKSYFRDWNDDIRIIVLSGEELGMVAISPRRRMLSLLRVPGETKVWIPGGLGWYQVKRLEKIIDQEKNEELVKKMAFYNFGFLSKVVMRADKIENWDDTRQLWSAFGWKQWLKIKWMLPKMLPWEEVLTGERVDEVRLDDLALRDLSDSRLANEESRLSVINVSDDVGLANFIARRLAWAGLTVVDVSRGGENLNKCRIVGAKNATDFFSWQVINGLWECDQETDDRLAEGEIELYLDGKLAKMLEYSETYVGSF